MMERIPVQYDENIKIHFSWKIFHWFCRHYDNIIFFSPFNILMIFYVMIVCCVSVCVVIKTIQPKQYDVERERRKEKTIWWWSNLSTNVLNNQWKLSLKKFLGKKIFGPLATGHEIDHIIIIIILFHCFNLLDDNDQPQQPTRYQIS